MELFRIGDKVISKDKLMLALEDILQSRVKGATQEEAAQRAGVPRSFVSNIETLGALRHGKKIAFIAFPISNAAEAMALAQSYGIDLSLALSQDDRERVGEGSASDMFNRMIDTLATLRSFDTVVVAASDYRIDTFKRIIDGDIIGITLGPSPLTEDQELDLEVLRRVFEELAFTAEAQDAKPTSAPEENMSALQIAKRWLSSKR